MSSLNDPEAGPKPSLRGATAVPEEGTSLSLERKGLRGNQEKEALLNPQVTTLA